MNCFFAIATTLILSYHFSNAVIAGEIDRARNDQDRNNIALVEELPEALPGIVWRVKQALYGNFIKIALSSESPQGKLPKPTQDDAELISFNQLDSRIPINSIFTSKAIPTEENAFVIKVAASALDFMEQRWPLATDGLPQIAPDPIQAMKNVYSYGSIKPAPIYPLSMQYELPPYKQVNYSDILGALSLSGCFADYIEHVSGNRYKIDMSRLEQFRVKEGYYTLGGVGFLKYDNKSQCMKTEYIRYDEKDHYPGDDTWDLSQKILLAGLSMDMTLNHHLLTAHMMVCGTFSAVNNKYLSPTNPLRVLMHSHQYRTIETNNDEIKTLIDSPFSFAPSIYSYDMESIKSLVNQTIEKFDISLLDAHENLKRRGMDESTAVASDGKKIHYPYRDNILRLWEIIHSYVSTYTKHYYPTDDALQSDEIINWYTMLDNYIPNGINKYTREGGGLTLNNLNNIITLFIYTGSVIHTNVNAIPFNYDLWYDCVPPHVRLDGKRPSIGVHQFHVNTRAAVVSYPTNLTEDFSYLAFDKIGANFMEKFSLDMNAYQTELDLHSNALKLAALYEENEELRRKKEMKAQDFALTTLFPKQTPISISS